MKTTARQLGGNAMLRCLAASIQANVPVLVWGDPGGGKTAVITDLGESLGRHIEVVIGSTRDQTDYQGLPIEKDGDMTYASPAWVRRLNSAKKGLLVADEVNLGTSQVLKAQLRVFQERWVGEVRMDDSVSIVAMANPVDSSADALEITPPVANRFAHLDWDFDQDVWLSNLVSSFEHVEYPAISSMITAGSQADTLRARSLVAAFLKSNRGLIDQKVPEALGTRARDGGVASSYGYGTRRSWDNLGKVLSYLHHDDDAAVLTVARGLVGEGAGREFFNYYKSADLYDPEAVMDGTTKVDWHDGRDDRLYALVQAVTALAASRGTAEAFTKALAVFDEAVSEKKKDIVVPSVRTMLPRVPSGATVPKTLVAGLSDVVLVGNKVGV